LVRGWEPGEMEVSEQEEGEELILAAVATAVLEEA
jgi:hypothetical protein